MIAISDLEKLTLPDKTLCLTFDDGPGPLSSDIGDFLHQHKIRATFFVVGKYAELHPDILEKIHNQNHIIANHTYEHPDLPYYVSAHGDVIDQIVRTNALIGRFNQNKTTFFRPPYGKWSPEVAIELAKDFRSSYKHVGPVYWDVPGIDCYYWRLGKSVDETVDAYLKEIREKGSGVIVMHDEIADMDFVKSLNKTNLLVKKLIPILIEEGYTFIGLDEIQDKQFETCLDEKVKIVSENGLHFSLKNDEIIWSHDPNAACLFDIQYTGDARIEVLLSNGNKLSSGQDNKLGLVDSKNTQFHLIPVRGNKFMIRSFSGNYFSNGKEAERVEAAAEFMRNAAVLEFINSAVPFRKKLSLKERYEQWLRRLNFIRSKVLQK